MGHRALVAYERPDGSYNLHYSHWGACNLRLKHDITPETPFGGDRAEETHQLLCRTLRTSTDEQAVSRYVRKANLLASMVNHDPMAIGLTKDEIVTEYLDFLHHEAFFEVAQDFEVTAYRTHWFGLTYDCETVTDAPTVGNGALRTVRWVDCEPVGDGAVRGEFRALKDVVGDMVDRGVFTPDEAQQYLQRKLGEWVRDRRDLIIRMADRRTSPGRASDSR